MAIYREFDAEDPRVARTRLRLADAVLSLAAERDISSASVSELARRAGVNRTTFYLHAETPLELLTRTLSRKLDDLRARTFKRLANAGRLRHEQRRITLTEIVAHILEYESVYGSADRKSSVHALRNVLAEHVKQSVLLLLREGYVVSPSTPESEATHIYAAFLAYGVAGAVETWLIMPKPRDDKLLIEAIEAMYPKWYVSKDLE